MPEPTASDFDHYASKGETKSRPVGDVRRVEKGGEIFEERFNPATGAHEGTKKVSQFDVNIWE